ncbi:hypothetical protein [Rhizobium leguminosarum]|uniref:hypothetical protein n=1 Tax=Rhizobium leguminosarum TaxID=384 RepID=UPI001C98CFE4|nr:hypothetical protein [Rhizobium leguminosarum]MBY5700925.1 hypothetical protein [Rhizobium leguminosarum]
MTLSHIDALIRGHDLPQPALSKTIIRAILDVLSESWAEICSRYPDDVRRPEVDVSAHLAIEFSRRCAVDNRLKRTVAKAIPAPEMLNFDGSSLQKRPDVTIQWRVGMRLSPLIVECKLIDAAERKGIDLYSSRGILRFIDGTYAWSEQEAVMVAFVRDNSKVGALTPHLKLEGHQERYSVQEMPVHLVDERSRGIATTRHGRNFLYPLRSAVPGPITLWHLWLDLVEAEEDELAVA